jgi:hypothetical protein
MMKPLAALFAGLLLVAPAAANPPPNDALIGTWDIVDAAPAPWADAKERAGLAAQAKKLIKTPVAFGRGDVTSPAKPLACKKADYEGTDYSPDAMFRGALLEPNQDRVVREMGFAKGDVPGVDVICESETLSYHFRDKTTILVAVDNIVYTLKKTK